MELTAGNLSRPRGPGRGQQICEESPVTGLSQNFPPDLRAPASKSLRLGWDFHTSAIFSDLPTPPTYIHAAQKIPTQTPKSILGGLGCWPCLIKGKFPIWVILGGVIFHVGTRSPKYSNLVGFDISDAYIV